MVDETPNGFVVGDRSQGYEVTGRGSLAGLDAAYQGKDTRDRDTPVTLIHLADDQDQSSIFDLARTFEQLNQDALIGPRTVIRFGGGSAVVIGKEQGAPLGGETLSVCLRRRERLSPGQAAPLFLPLLEALNELHGRGIAHGQISAAQIIVGRDDEARLFGPWLANGGEAHEQFTITQAPELISGEAASPVSDIYSVCALLRWSLTGTPPPSADARLASQAQHDDDPLTPIIKALPGLDGDLARALETGLRLHPATRPQSMAALSAVLEPLVTTTGNEEETATPPPLPSSPWSGQSSAPTTDGPPPITPSRPRSGGVPPIPKANRTSTIGEAPPPLPSSGGSAKPKRKIGIGTILSFAIALGVAWLVASGGLMGDDKDADGDVQRDSNRPTEVNRPVDDEPRKGPRGTDRDEDTQATGVREQICNSRFTFETARDSGRNALRAYLQQCDGVDSEFVEAARDVLGLN